MPRAHCIACHVIWQGCKCSCDLHCCSDAEGRIEPSDGTLMCSYHGWRFQGDGRCTDIPQALDPKANAAACSSPRSCAVSRPTKVRLLLNQTFLGQSTTALQRISSPHIPYFRIGVSAI
jgi:hypothetical protein